MKIFWVGAQKTDAVEANKNLTVYEICANLVSNCIK